MRKPERYDQATYRQQTALGKLHELKVKLPPFAPSTLFSFASHWKHSSSHFIRLYDESWNACEENIDPTFRLTKGIAFLSTQPAKCKLQFHSVYPLQRETLFFFGSACVPLTTQRNPGTLINARQCKEYTQNQGMRKRKANMRGLNRNFCLACRWEKIIPRA